MIKIKNLSKSFRTEEIETIALNGVSMEVKKGEFVAIMGPSGCGKSTLLHILGLLDNPDEGSYLLDGEEMGHLKEKDRTRYRKGRIGFVFQSFNLIDELTDRYGDPPRPVTALLDVALLRAAAADTGVTDITQKGQTLLLSLGQRMDVPSLMAVCTLPAYRSRLLLSAGEHPKLTLHLKPGEEALDAAGHLVEALTLKRKEISGETPAEGGTL